MVRTLLTLTHSNGTIFISSEEEINLIFLEPERNISSNKACHVLNVLAIFHNIPYNLNP